MTRACPALVIACLGVAGCDSPEAKRTRGGGPGGDSGNRAKQVLMHEGSQQFWRTPDLIEVEAPSLEPARHAQQISRQ